MGENKCWLCEGIIHGSKFKTTTGNVKHVWCEKHLQKNSLGDLLKIDCYFNNFLVL